MRRNTSDGQGQRIWPWALGVGILAAGLAASLAIRDKRLNEPDSGGGFGLPGLPGMGGGGGMGGLFGGGGGGGFSLSPF